MLVLLLPNAVTIDGADVRHDSLLDAPFVHLIRHSVCDFPLYVSEVNGIHKVDFLFLLDLSVVVLCEDFNRDSVEFVSCLHKN